ncbi:MAG: DUF4430 domain-containing protein [Erysipelotrichaceae bacterium]|nr:DUF4430 domain-containing protein [Erysipelotrichaceae bacterium]
MFKKNLILKIVLSVIALGAVVLCVVLLHNSFKPDYDGIITVEVIDLDGSVINKKEIEFKENDQLMNLIEDNFNNVTYQNGMIMSVEDYNTPSDWSTFLSIYVNDEMSPVGLADIVFTDGTKISLIITEYISDWS